jgi:hypothetical protein
MLTESTKQPILFVLVHQIFYICMSFYTSLSENLVRIGSFAPPVFKAAIMVLINPANFK